MKRTLGVCYYPEHWPEKVWAADAKRMADIGLSWVRIGEFAWSRLESTPGDLQSGWLDRAIETLAAEGLKVVLGTPTATPPRWMLTKHPDMLAVDENGNPRKFGSRRHYCFSHEGFRKECVRIATLLGKRYGKNPHVAAWQIDNEYGCHNTAISYSKAAEAAFRTWLSDRYGSVKKLNRAWGNVFWSMEYGDFDEIDLPNMTVTQTNPAHVMAFRRFTSDQVVAFNSAQVEVLRQHTEAPLIHNYMGRILEFDHYEVGKDLDIASWDSYPLGFLMDRVPASDDAKARYLRQGDPDMQAFHHDLYRTVGKGRWWIMEQQPGPVNWAPWNPAPLPGITRLWAWEAFAHGAETVCYFRWRQAPFAQEQMHAGLMRPDGVPATGMTEAAQVAREIADLPDVGTAKADVTLVFDYPSQWAWETLPQGADFDYFELCFSYYRALRRAGLSVDIQPADAAALKGYKLALIPGLAHMDKALKSALSELDVEVIAGPRTAQKSAEMSIALPLGPALPGLDTKVSHVESLPPGTEVQLLSGGSMLRWMETVEDSPDAVERTLDGRIAILRSEKMTYLAGWPSDDLMDEIVAEACMRAGVMRTPVPEGLRVRDTATHRFLFNYSPIDITWQGTRIPAAGVHWTERPD